MEDNIFDEEDIIEEEVITEADLEPETDGVENETELETEESGSDIDDLFEEEEEVIEEEEVVEDLNVIDRNTMKSIIARIREEYNGRIGALEELVAQVIANGGMTTDETIIEEVDGEHEISEIEAEDEAFYNANRKIAEDGFGF